MMRILIVSDLHKDKIVDKVPDSIMKTIDFIISAGDLEDNYPLPKEGIGVFGNHESSDELKTHSLLSCHKNIINKHGMTFFGIQGVCCGEKRYKNPNRKRWYHQWEPEIDKFLNNAPYVTFFITHERAKGIFDDRFKSATGIKAFRKYIDEKQPTFFVSGHMANSKYIIQVGETICINPHNKEYDYVLLELHGDQKNIKFMRGMDIIKEVTFG